MFKKTLMVATLLSACATAPQIIVTESPYQKQELVIGSSLKGEYEGHFSKYKPAQTEDLHKVADISMNLGRDTYHFNLIHEPSSKITSIEVQQTHHNGNNYDTHCRLRSNVVKCELQSMYERKTGANPENPYSYPHGFNKNRAYKSPCDRLPRDKNLDEVVKLCKHQQVAERDAGTAFIVALKNLL